MSQAPLWAEARPPLRIGEGATIHWNGAGPLAFALLGHEGAMPLGHTSSVATTKRHDVNRDVLENRAALCANVTETVATRLDPFFSRPRSL